MRPTQKLAQTMTRTAYFSANQHQKQQQQQQRRQRQQQQQQSSLKCMNITYARHRKASVAVVLLKTINI